MDTFEFINQNKNQIKKIAHHIANALNIGDVLLLHGEMGTGKTFFTSQLCKCLHVTGIVNSPSYVLLNEYYGKFQIFHYDLYRLSSVSEALEIGIFDRISVGITVIEWPELINEYINVDHINIYLTYIGNNRNIKIKTNIGGKLCHILKQL